MREERKTWKWKGNANETAGRHGSILVMFLSGIKGQSEHCSLAGVGREGGNRKEREV